VEGLEIVFFDGGEEFVGPLFGTSGSYKRSSARYAVGRNTVARGVSVWRVSGHPHDCQIHFGPDQSGLVRTQ